MARNNTSKPSRPSPKSASSPETPKIPAPATPPLGDAAGRDFLICALLALATLAIYLQVSGHTFVNFDDDQYVSSNDMVKAGLTQAGFVWAFTKFSVANWHPLTWLSHMLDCQLFGLNAGRHLLVNVALHAVNSILVFRFFRTATDRVWPSATVAALFAVHPLHVESVAWLAERKDVLSTFFWMLALIAYARYVKKPTFSGYATVAGFFVLGLLSKPMVVTLPFALLLMDVWPLNRIRFETDDSATSFPSKSWPLLKEKLPLLGLSAAASVVTFLAQAKGGTVATFTKVPLGLRLENAAVSLLTYLGKTVLPTKLAAFYPYDYRLPIWKTAAAVLVAAAITGLALKRLRENPYLAVGWLWFVGTLVPVIGIVQVGDQSMADRYTYIPLVGVFAAAAWGGSELAERKGANAKFLAATAGIVVVGYAAVAWHQVKYWKDPGTLFSHVAAVTPENYLAHHLLGNALSDLGRPDEALAQYREALRIKPDYGRSRNNLAILLRKQGKIDEAISEYRQALQSEPENGPAHFNLALALDDRGQFDQAEPHYREGIRLQPETVAPLVGFAGSLSGHDRPDEALGLLAQALRLKPDHFEANYRSAILYYDKKDFEKAERFFREAVRLSPNNERARFNLAMTLIELKQPDRALSELSMAARLNPRYAEARYNLGLLLAQQKRINDAIEEFSAAAQLSPDFAEAHYQLGIALHSRARFREALDALQRANRLNPNLPGLKERVADLEQRVKKP